MIKSLKYLVNSIISILRGMRVTFKNCFDRRVTLQYPQEKMSMVERYRGMVDLVPEDCIVCYQCVKICPTAALYLSHNQVLVEQKKKNEINKFTFDVELCCFCGLCAEICPTDAMYMNKIYEASSYGHKELKIDLMDAEKYKHWDKTYQVKKPAKVKKEGEE